MLTQPVIWLRRMAMAPAAATSPGVAWPCRHSMIDPPTRITGNTPAITISDIRKVLLTTPKSSARSRNPAMAPKAARSSCSAWANSLTVLMLVMVSTTWPVIIARADARAPDFARMRGRKNLISTR